MIYKSNAGNKIANSEALFTYLDKSEEKEFDESFFSDSEDDVPVDDAAMAIDNNVKGLGKDDSKYFMLTLNPSPLELSYIENDPEKMKAYTRAFMDEYAKNFHREGVKSGANLVYFAKVEHHRYSRKTHKKKKGLNMHVHIVVSRKDKMQRYKLSPNSNAKASYQTPNKIKSAGFNRNIIKEKSETLFDAMFDYKRGFEETFEYQNTLKNGTVEEKLKIKEIADKLDKPSIAIKNLLIDANSNGLEGGVQEAWRKMETTKSLNKVLETHKGLEPVNLLIPESIKATNEAILFPLIKLNKEGKGELVDIVPYAFKEEEVNKLEADDKKDGLIVFVVMKPNDIELEKPQLLIAEEPLDAISYAQMNDIENYIVIATAGSPSKKQLKQLEILKNEDIEKIVISRNNVIKDFNANIISKAVDSSFKIQPFGKFKDFNEQLVSINESAKKLLEERSQPKQDQPNKTNSEQSNGETANELLGKSPTKELEKRGPDNKAVVSKEVKSNSFRHVKKDMNDEEHAFNKLEVKTIKPLGETIEPEVTFVEQTKNEQESAVIWNRDIKLAQENKRDVSNLSTSNSKDGIAKKGNQSVAVPTNEAPVVYAKNINIQLKHLKGENDSFDSTFNEPNEKGKDAEGSKSFESPKKLHSNDKENQPLDEVVKGVLVGEMNISKDQKKAFFTLQTPKGNGSGFNFINCAALGRNEVSLIQKNFKKGDTVLVVGRHKPYSFRNKANEVKKGNHLLVSKFKVYRPKKVNSEGGAKKNRVNFTQKAARIRSEKSRYGRKSMVKNFGLSLLKNLLFSKKIKPFLEAVAYMPPSQNQFYENDYEDEIRGLK